MSNSGIDYGMGQTNRDPENGIRYGVISSHEVLQAWSDSSEPIYEEEEEIEDAFGQIFLPNLDYAEPIGYLYEGEGYKIVQYSNDSDLFVIKSPYYTQAQFCAPCAPGAGNLNHPTLDGPATYCLGPDWFDNEATPYPIFEVRKYEETIKKVNMLLECAKILRERKETEEGE